MIIYAVVMRLLNEIAMKKYVRYRNKWHIYLHPLLAAVPMAAVAGGVYYGLYALLAKTALHAQLVNVLCLGVAAVLAAAVYFVVYLMVADLSDEDIHDSRWADLEAACASIAGAWAVGA